MELKRIESLQPKKFDKYYLERFCTSLSRSNIKNNLNYFIQRKNLEYNIKNPTEDKEDLLLHKISKKKMMIMKTITMK